MAIVITILENFNLYFPKSSGIRGVGKVFEDDKSIFILKKFIKAYLNSKFAK